MIWMPSSLSFTEWSKDVAAGFLANVLVVDDRARLAGNDEVAKPTALITPLRQAGTAGNEETAPRENGAHSLDAKALIDQFARLGIICGACRPGQDEIDSFPKSYFRVIERADVVILDWVLYEFKNGQKTLELIRELLKATKKEKGRARLILIYTGENDLTKIVTDIRKELRVTDNSDSYTIDAGALRVSVFAKEGNRLDHKKREIKEKDLPETVITEFSLMTGGLVSNVALRSLAVLRANTHQLLRTFNRTLDAPYVTHRTLLLPEEASHHIVPLIVAEIQSILEDEKIGSIAGTPSVTRWLKHQVQRGMKFSLQHTPEKTAFKGMAYLLKHGVGKVAVDGVFASHSKFALGMLRDKKDAAGQLLKNLTERLTLESERATVSDQNLAMLMSIRSRYVSPPPILRLGTIVLETKGKHSRFLLCVQPVCDSVRIEKERAFPFLPLRSVSGYPECEFLIKEQSKVLKFALQTKPFEAKMITFKPSGRDREIVARNAKTGRFFKATGRGTTYRWVADLKPDHAQRVANDYAYKISRVGLNESEWLRKISNPKN
jgi:Response receiver domain